MSNPYWEKIGAMAEKQRNKGLEKYGQGLENNKTLNTEESISYLQEELIDGLMYCEHLKTKLKEVAFTPNDYMIAALRTANHKSGFEAIHNGCLGLSGEAGEVLDLLKKHMHQGHDLNKEKMTEELGDILWYAAILANALETDLETVMKKNIQKLWDRYPEGFDSERSVNRDEFMKVACTWCKHINRSMIVEPCASCVCVGGTNDHFIRKVGHVDEQTGTKTSTKERSSGEEGSGHPG